MSGSSRYNGPGAALRGQPRAPRQQSRPREDSYAASSVNGNDRTDSYSGSDRQRTHQDKHDPSSSAGMDQPDMASPRPYAPASSHQRQWSDTSSLQGGTLPPVHPYHGSQNHPYNNNNNHSPYMGPSSGSPASPPPLSSSPSSSSSYFYASDQRSHGNAYAPSQRHQQFQQQSPSQSRAGPTNSGPTTPGSGPYVPYQQGSNAGGSRPGNNGYGPNGHYDQSPMMSPTSPDSWRSPPGPRGYSSQTPQYTPSTQYRQPVQQKPYSTASSVSNDDHGSHHGRPTNQGYDYDSDDYYNRQGGRAAPGHGPGQSQDQGNGRFADSRGGRALSYSTSIASNTSSVLAARRERNERKEQSSQRQKPPVDDWLTSPTGTEQDTEILPWSDDEAIVTKAVRSPPTGYSKEKTLPPIPGGGVQTRKRMDSDMIKVEVGGATTVIPTTDENSGVNFIKNVPNSPPPPSRYNNPSQGPSGATQSITGAANSLRAAAVFSNQNPRTTDVGRHEQPSRPQRPSEKRASSDWGGKRISLDDMLSSPPTVTQDSRQQAINSWRTSPPLRGRDDKSSFTDMKSKRRSSLPDKIVPNWNENTQNWRSSIGQKRPSWMASNTGVFEDQALGKKNKDDFLAQKQTWAEHKQQLTQPTAGAANKTKDALIEAKKRVSDNSSLHRRSRSWSPRPDLSRNESSTSNKALGGKASDKSGDKSHAAENVRRRDSYASSISRSRSRSHSPSPQRRSRDLKARDSFSRSRSRSLHSRSRSRSGSRSRPSRHSRYTSHSRSRSRSHSASRSRSRSRLSLARDPSGSKGVERSLDAQGRDRESSRFSWHSNDDAATHRRSWDSVAQEVKPDVLETRKVEGGLSKSGGPRYSTTGEEDLTDYEAEFAMRNGKGAETSRAAPAGEVRKPAARQPLGGHSHSDTESMDSPPLKVQYARRGGPDDEDDGDDQIISSKHPASIISTYNLPPATSPISPPLPPPLPTSYAFAGDNSVKSRGAAGQPTKPVPPSIPDSPVQAPKQNPSLMTAITTVSIEAATSTLLSSRVSVESFKNVPGHAGADPRNGPHADTDVDSEFEHDIPVLQPSYVSMTTAPSGSNGSSSTAPSSTPISITTTQLSRNESSTSSVSVLSARSGRSFVSSSSAHSASSILSGAPPPQRAPPPIPLADSAPASPTIGSGLFGGQRSGSGGSARGTRSGLSKQILPPVIPPPPGPPPEMPASKPSYGIIPPPIPSSFNSPTTVTASRSVQGSEPAAAAAVAATSSSAIQIQMLADEDQSKSQMGAITIETDERLLTRLNNRIAQLERELEFANQDLEASQDDALELQNKVRDLEHEIEDLAQTSDARAGDNQKSRNEEHDAAREAWEQERAQLLKDMDRLREDHQDELDDSLQRERSKHAEEVERLSSDHAVVLEDRQARAIEEQDRLHEEHSRALDDHKERLQTEHQRSMDDLLAQLESVGIQHAQEMESQRSEHEAKYLEHQQESYQLLESTREEAAKHTEELKLTHQQSVEDLERRLEEMEKSLSDVSTERDQAFKDLVHHKKETEQALDRLEVVLAEDKQTHAQLIQDLEQKSKRLEDRIAELESELQELMQDNVQIVEEMQRREESWAQERALIRSGEDDESGHEARFQEVHEQLLAMTESKRQADVQFQGIVKGLLREASGYKKELEERRTMLDQERDGKEELASLLESIRQEKQAFEQEKEVLEHEKQTLEQEKQTLEQKIQLHLQEIHSHAQEKQTLEQEIQSHLQEIHSHVQEKQTLEQEIQSHLQEIHSHVQEKEIANEKWTSLERSHGDIEAQLEAQKRSGNEAMTSVQNELQDRLWQQEQALEAERVKVQDLESAMEQSLSKTKADLQQEQFVWKTRLDQVEAALKTKEAQVRKLEQEADATIKIQTDLLHSMERDAANSQRKLEASLMTKMKEMEQTFEEEKRRIHEQTHQELTQRYEQDSVQKETNLQQQLESIHQQELAMAKQELSSKHEQQLRAMKQQHDSALEQSGLSLKQQQKSVEDQLEKLQQQAEQERSEKDVAIKDRTFLERRMAGHDRRQKELEESLETLQQQLDQSRAKFGQDLQEVERSKMSLERKLGMAKEDVEELNKIRDELEGDRDELRKELQRLKKANNSSKAGPAAGADTAAWDAERRHLQEQVRKLEDEVQIMLEKNMNLTIELSMKG